MTEPDHVYAYPRAPTRAQRVPGAQGRPDGWSTLIQRTWHSDAEFADQWVPAEIFEALLDAALCHECRPALAEIGECALCNALQAYYGIDRPLPVPLQHRPADDGWMDGYVGTIAVVVDHLNHAMTNRGVNEWLSRVHPFLDGKTPIEALADKDRWDEVIGLAERTRSAP